MMIPDVTFVCCVEAGPLEAMTVRMIESLRRWGGTFCQCSGAGGNAPFRSTSDATNLKPIPDQDVRYVRCLGRRKIFLEQLYE